MDQDQATQELIDLKAQVEKITQEVITANAAKDAALAAKDELITALNEKIAALEAAAANAGVLNAAFDTAMSDLKAVVKVEDDLNPDAVVDNGSTGATDTGTVTDGGTVTADPGAPATGDTPPVTDAPPAV